MKLSDGVEWAIHCVLLLGGLPDGTRLSGAAMAEFHGVPESYLLKHLKALTAADILKSAPGPRGGYSLARKPAALSLLDIVRAVDGDQPAFRCTEIRRRGPCALHASAYPKPCGVNQAMLRAEATYRAALAQETIADLIEGFVETADPRAVDLARTWLSENTRTDK